MNDKKIEEYEFIHELNNNLTICKGYFEILKKEDNILDKRLLTIEKEISQTINLINKYKNNKFITIPNNKINITELIKEIIGDIDYLYKQDHCLISLSSNKDIYIIGEKEEIRQVIVNLLKNSQSSRIKDNLTITVDISEKGDNCIIEIIDNGCGMTEEKVMELNGKTVIKPNNYYGLSYCRQVIKNHNGDLEIKSKKGLGTSITIYVPKYN